MRRALCLAAVLAAPLTLAACGSSDDEKSTSTAAQSKAGDLAGIKTYLTDHTQRLATETAAIKQNAEAYYALSQKPGGLESPEAAKLVKEGQELFKRANPAYEEMEGVVAGVPKLADYDVIIDAGGDASDPENAVPFDIKTKDGKTYKQPGNFNFLIETALYGTEPKFAAQGAKPDFDGNGKTDFGEALPDPAFYLAAATDFDKTARELDAEAKKFTPETKDALTALVVMTPTMSEYFEAWKNSRFVSGDKASETAFVAASRLQDISDILGGLVLVYSNVKPQIEKADPAQAKQIETSLKRLNDQAARLRDEEAGGKTFTPQDADQLGGELQDQAEAIAGQISQAAGQLNIKLET